MHQTGEQTKKQLEQAFWQLYLQQSIEKITVKQVTTSANLHRSTFYLHYADVYQVLENIEQRLLTAIDAVPTMSKVTDAQATEYAQQLRAIFDREPAVVQELIVRQRDAQFLQTVRWRLQQRVAILFQLPATNTLTPAQQFAVVNVTQMIATLFLNWAAQPTADFADLTTLTAGVMRQGALPTLAHDFGLVLPINKNAD